jgi:hypothetical protein
MPGTKLATADKYQIALFGGQDWIVPVDIVNIVVGINQNIARMSV